MLFHRYWFHPLHIQYKTCKERAKILSPFQNTLRLLPFVCDIRGHHLLSPHGRFCWKPNTLLRGLLHTAVSVLRSQKVLMSSCSFLESRKIVKAATLLLYERRKQSLLFFSVLTPLSLCERQGVSGASPFYSLENTCKASEPQNAAKCQPPGCGLLQIVFINTLIWNLVLNTASPFPSPAFNFCHHFSATGLWGHVLATWPFFFFYNNCSVSSSSLEFQVPNCGTSKI